MSAAVSDKHGIAPTSGAHLPRLEPGNRVQELLFMYEQLTILLRLVPPSKGISGLTGSRKLIFTADVRN